MDFHAVTSKAASGELSKTDTTHPMFILGQSYPTSRKKIVLAFQSGSGPA